MSDSEEDIFEKTYGSLTNSKSESDEEERERTPTPIPEPVEEEEKPKKKTRKKAEMTPERKAQLLENLRKGREKAKLNRQKKAKLKKIKKAEEDLKIDEEILEHAKKSYNKHSKEKELQDEIEKLKKQLEEKEEKKLEPIEENIEIDILEEKTKPKKVKNLDTVIKNQNKPNRPSWKPPSAWD